MYFYIAPEIIPEVIVPEEVAPEAAETIEIVSQEEELELELETEVNVEEASPPITYEAPTFFAKPYLDP